MPALTTLLLDYGVEVRPDLVVDRSCGTATFVSGFVRFSVPYLLWPMAGKDNLDDVSPITNQLERVVFMWTSSIRLRQPAGGPVEVTVLARSSEQSWSEEHKLNLDPQQRFLPMTDTGPRNLAVLLEGSFQSHFAGREAPPVVTAEDDVTAAGPPPHARAERSPETQIVVVGNSRFVEQAYLAQYPENRTFLLNVVDWLTLGESLIGIRSRAVTARPLEEISASGKSTVRFAATFGIPIVLIVWGLIRRYMRSARRGILP